MATTTPDAEGARLLHERDERAFGRRIGGVRRQKAVHLVEDDERAQPLRAGQRAHPREHLFEQNAEHQRALVVVQMRDAHDHGGRATRSRA